MGIPHDFTHGLVLYTTESYTGRRRMGSSSTVESFEDLDTFPHPLHDAVRFALEDAATVWDPSVDILTGVVLFERHDGHVLHFTIHELRNMYWDGESVIPECMRR